MFPPIYMSKPPKHSTSSENSGGQPRGVTRGHEPLGEEPSKIGYWWTIGRRAFERNLRRGMNEHFLSGAVGRSCFRVH